MMFGQLILSGKHFNTSCAIYTPNAYKVICRVTRMAELQLIKTFFWGGGRGISGHAQKILKIQITIHGN
jgi:hypothetical protein